LAKAGKALLTSITAVTANAKISRFITQHTSFSCDYLLTACNNDDTIPRTEDDYILQTEELGRPKV